MIRKSIVGLMVGLWVMAAANAFAECVESCPDGTADFNGFCYTESGGEITITDYAGSDTDIAIPTEIDGKPVVSIGEEAFYACTGLSSIAIPDSLTSIGAWAFYSCTGLTGIVIPDSVTSVGASAFQDCSGLTSVTIGNSITSIEESVFGYCYGLTSVTIPDNVTSIGDMAFYACISLTSVTIPGSVTSIGWEAFVGCTGLVSIEVDPGNEQYSSVEGVLYNNDKSILMQYPAGKTDTEFSIPDSVTSIGDNAFCDCTALTSVTIPESVTSIGYIAFEGCTGLTGLTIPGSVISIGDYAFSSCTGLTSVTIPGSVTSIGAGAFSSCTGLTSVTIPGSVTSIGVEAFFSCSSLSGAYFLGNSPLMEDNVFGRTASNFKVCYTPEASGFTTPTWEGYPALRRTPPPCSATVRIWRRAGGRCCRPRLKAHFILTPTTTCCGRSAMILAAVLTTAHTRPSIRLLAAVSGHLLRFQTMRQTAMPGWICR